MEKKNPVKLNRGGVSAVIPSYNCKKLLFRLLDSLLKSDFDKLEVIVVDNGSSDGTLKEGKKKYNKVRWINAGKHNIGWTGSYNLGFANASRENHILMIDSDVVVTPFMIKNLVGRLESSKKIGIVTPMILYLNDVNWVNQAGAEVNLWTGKVYIGWGPKVNFLEAKKVQNSGTVMIFKKDLVSKIGGFENWFITYADPEYCLRALKAGYETWYEPSAVAFHDQSKDPNYYEPRVLSRAYLLGRNRTLFMRKYGYFLPTYIAFLPLILGYYLYTSLKFGIFPKWIELVRGTWDGFFYPINKSLKVPLF